MLHCINKLTCTTYNPNLLKGDAVFYLEQKKRQKGCFQFFFLNISKLDVIQNEKLGIITKIKHK